MSKDDKIKLAAKAAGKWWATRLGDQQANRREAFAVALTAVIKKVMRGEIKWVTQIGKHPDHPDITIHQTVQAPGDGKARNHLSIEFDYDPDATLETALQEVFGPGLTVFQLKDMFPRKHDLTIDLKAMVLKPKEGYGNWTAEIPIR